MIPLKNLFLSDKKKRHYVLSTTALNDVNLKLVSTILSAPQCRFGTEDKMKLLLGVEPGAVTPLAAINDNELVVDILRNIFRKAVTFVFDENLKNKDVPILVHPLVNTASLALSIEDIIKIVIDSGHEIEWINLSKNNTENDVTTPILKKINKITDKKINKSQEKFGTEMLGITIKKTENFSEWYTQVITRGELVDYYDISGCYVLRPSSYFMWEKIQEFINKEIKQLGVQNCYFPMFVSKHRLEVEKNHIEGFSAEVAWVTKYGNANLAEPIAIRPTSETIMYPSFSKWIRSHRDLPLRLNQWNQVVRWEFKQPTPFIRTREFLWQEGHTAHSNNEEAEEMVFKILDIYARVYEDLLAVPIVKGTKSEGEKFAGGKITSTIEAFIDTNGRAVQAATSHHLGTNFSKMFQIEYEDCEGKKQLVHQTSWGLTTRSLGVAIMIHGDDKGMIMPPQVAPIQVVLIPIIYKEKDYEEILIHCRKIESQLIEANIRIKIDDRENYTPGWKYNDWEKKGVCIRLEIGPRDIEKNTLRLVRRDNNEKFDIPRDQIISNLNQQLNDIHLSLLNKARQKLNNSIVKINNWDEVMPALNKKKLILAPWCEDLNTEEQIKKETLKLSTEKEDNLVGDLEGAAALTGAMKPLCIPLDQPIMPDNTLCFFTKRPAKRWCLFGRSY